MKTKIPEIHKQINKKDTFKVLENKYSIMGPLWVSHQIEWFNGVYAAFKDHDKYLIIIYLTKKTLDIYSNTLIKLSYEEFFSSRTLEIEKFNISEISTKLNIPKESARRKIIELESQGVIRRINKKIIIDTSCFSYSKPINTIKRISAFLATLSTMCYDEKVSKKRITSEKLELVIKNNFTNIWNFYYEMQIPMILNYKKFFKDYESFHIFGTCVVNQHFDARKLSEAHTDRESFLKSFFVGEKLAGINAMSISEISGIPRATVIRKLKKLVKVKNLTIDDKKHYRLKGDFYKTLSQHQRSVLYSLANFSCKVYNLAALNEK